MRLVTVTAIDPGKEGALARITQGGVPVVYPLAQTFTELRDQLFSLDQVPGNHDHLVIVERQVARPGQNVAQGFVQARGYQRCLDAVDEARDQFVSYRHAALHTPMPRTWKAAIGLPDEKDDKQRKINSVNLCFQKHSAKSLTLLRSPKHKTPDHNMAEAILLADWGILVGTGRIKFNSTKGEDS